MGCELKLFMLPLRGSELACDQAHPMHTTEVTIDEPVGVFVVGAGLAVSPVAVENVLMGVDEAAGSCYRALVERIRSHQIILSGVSQVRNQ